MMGIKENNIRSIDDKINSIMKKHVKCENEEREDMRMPLGNKNFNEAEFDQKRSLIDFGS